MVCISLFNFFPSCSDANSFLHLSVFSFVVTFASYNILSSLQFPCIERLVLILQLYTFLAINCRLYYFVVLFFIIILLFNFIHVNAGRKNCGVSIKHFV